MKALKQVFVIYATALLLMGGCAEMGLAPADSFDDKLAYAYGVHTAVQQSAAMSLRAKSISSEDAEQVLKLADESRRLLDGARAASKIGDISGANGKLLLATQILTQIQAYLRSQS